MHNYFYLLKCLLVSQEKLLHMVKKVKTLCSDLVDLGELDKDIDITGIVGLLSCSKNITRKEILNVYLPIAYHIVKFYTKNMLVANKTKNPFVIGVSGSVAVGKSSFSLLLQHLIRLLLPQFKICLVSSDNFLFSNEKLQQQGLFTRKGFPESYDVKCQHYFIKAILDNEFPFEIPYYCHYIYDIVENKKNVMLQSDIIILEGLNVLKNDVNEMNNGLLNFKDLVDFSIYIDARTDNIAKWYVKRFCHLKQLAENNPTSYLHKFSNLNYEQTSAYALDLWKNVNLLNLNENICLSKHDADFIIYKNGNHKVKHVCY